MKRVWQNERGMALAVAIFALVVVGALVAAALFMGTQEQRVAENQYRLGQSFGVVEAGAPELIAEWEPDSINNRRWYPFDTIKVSDRTTVGGTGSFGGNLWKLNRNLYYIDLTGADTLSRSGSAAFRRRGAGGRQRVGVVVRIRPLQIPTTGAFTGQGSSQVRGNALVDGTDHTPNASWTECAPADSVKPGMYVDGPVTVGGVNAEIEGNPPVLQDTAINNNTFNVFGDVSYDELAAQANITLAGGTLDPIQPSTLSGVCNKADVRNWGDGLNRANPCGGYFPIVHITGNVEIRQWQGQGILLVDGNLSVTGSFEYFGIVIVKGILATSGGGTSSAHFHGTVLAQNQAAQQHDIAGSAKVRYSKCAIVQALNAQSKGAIARSRSWVLLN
jgi:hypothetical protein